VNGSPSGPGLDRARYEPVLVEAFSGAALDPGRWVDHYLPQWTTPERSAARYELTDHGLRLLVEADQPPWRPEDGGLRVSSIQTATYSGPAGSPFGTHRHREGLVVRTPQPTRLLWAPTEGLVEVTMRAPADPTCMLAAWLVGVELRPEDSGEICVAELYGDAAGATDSRVRLGVKAHHDPRLTTSMTDVRLPFAATEEHRYAAEWGAWGVRFHVDDVLVHTVEQSLDYPLQLMVDLFELDPPEDRTAGYPKEGWVREVRGHRPVRGGDARAL
jgi:hypothetical protein